MTPSIDNKDKLSEIIIIVHVLPIVTEYEFENGKNVNTKQFQLTGFVLLFFFLSACSQTGIVPLTTVATPTPTVEPTKTARPTPTPVPVAECSPDVTPDFVDYAMWTKVNEHPILGHETWVDVYVDSLAEGTYLLATGDTFPVCAKIVKTHLEDAESDTITAVTVMVKMPAGYDPEHNDWWWGMYDETGKVAEMSGKVQVCIACHQPASDVDYVFSKAVVAATQQ